MKGKKVMPTGDFPTYNQPCQCINQAVCIAAGCQMLQHGHFKPQPIGCICPPGANKECERLDCPRKGQTP